MFNSMDTECSYVHTETRTRNPVLDFSNPKTRVWKNGPGFGNPISNPTPLCACGTSPHICQFPSYFFHNSDIAPLNAVVAQCSKTIR